MSAETSRVERKDFRHGHDLTEAAARVRPDRCRRCATIPSAMYGHSSAYYAHFHAGAARSAAVVLPIVRSLFRVHSVADFGCGTGAWLAAWRSLGVADVVGCDGDVVDRASLLFDPSRFVAADLSKPVRLERRFDLVQSLEVAEHLPPAAASTLVTTLAAHGPVVLFSAAPPGQGGEHHVNEQPIEYWRALFRQHDFQVVDALRPRLRADRRVEPWYRYNALFFVERSMLAGLDVAVRSRAVADDRPVPVYAPFGVRIRNGIVKHVPEPVVTRIAAGVRRLVARAGQGR